MAQELITWDTINIGTGITLSNGNLTAVIPSTVSTVRATKGKMVGKWYWEVKVDVVGFALIGIVNKDTSLSVGNFTQLTTKYYYYNGNKYAGATAYGASYTTGDTISVLLDLDIGTIEFYKNGVSQGVAFTDVKTLGEVFPAITNGSGGSNTTTTNFGATPFTYVIPSGYLPYNRYDANKVLFSTDDGKSRSINYKKESHNTTMTSNVLPSPLVASASTQLNATYNAFKAFQDYESNAGDSWRVSAGNSTGWIQIDFGVGKKANKIYVKSHLDGATGSLLTTCPKNFEILGSNDGAIFTLLGEVKNQVDWKSVESREFEFKNANSYRYYRVNVKENNGYVGYLNIGRIKFEYDEKNISSLPSQSEKSFMNHGMNQSDLASIDMYADFTEKHYIQDITTVLGSGKVFEHALDINKTLKKIKIQ